MLDTPEILKKLYNSLSAAIDRAYAKDAFGDHLTAISIETPTIATAITEIGERYDLTSLDKENIKESDADRYILHYHWMEEAKNFLILWRDIRLEGTKALHLLEDKRTDHISLKMMRDQSKSMLLNSLDVIKSIFPQWKSQLQTRSDQLKTQVLEWDKQINPWPEYKSQIKDITEQTRSISNLSNQLSRSNSTYKHIRRILQSYINKRKDNMNEISRCSEMALDSINDLNDKSDGTILSKKALEIEGIHKTLNQLFVDIHHLEQIEKIIDEMTDNVEVPISGENGILNIKKLSLKKNTQQWLESEIYLILYEIEEVEDQLKNKLKMQSTLGNLDLSRTKLRHKVSSWFKNTFSAYNVLRKKAKSERELSTSEKLVRYVDSRQFDADNRQYINIFLVKGYIGESFVIGRQDELDHFRGIYQNWLNGYRGSIVISGQRFSGKSLFVEYANIKVLDGKAIQLKPDTEYEINGRVFTANYNLKETLGGIIKHSYDSKPVVFIDDIELWYNKENSLSANVRSLCKIIDKYSSKIFFVVTMSNWFQYKMNKVYDINRVFQADINLDSMSLHEIRKVISIRQGATHKNLLNSDKKKISVEEFEKLTKKIHQNVDGNVGDALSKWAANTSYNDTNSVSILDKSFYTIPDIDDKDTLLLLETVIMSRKTNEYYLNQYFGEAFKLTYSTLLQRLINVGLVTRNVDNLIQINPKVVNDIGRLLENKHYLTFNHR